ncbi:response regulator transcription factor, partial [Sphaerobacter sp.]|uniref:response regulator transcription factor n=1 Tax=Sphaerobacter sp. TaxID=2099654 RepID=UPI001E17690F
MPSSTHHATILVVEDEPRLVRLIESILRTADYRVLTAGTGADALEMVALEAPDLILLDLLLPGDIDGFDVCRRVREFSDVPIIMLTARTQETDKLRGFELGADDYVTKPFSAKELLARVQAVLRRSRGFTAGPARLTVGDLVIDLAAHRVTRDGEDIHLTPTEFRLLVALARRPGRVIPHDQLLTEVWGAEYRDEVEYLRTYMRYLRQKLERNPTRPTHLLP